jgi:hypothetical protein
VVRSWPDGVGAVSQDSANPWLYSGRPLAFMTRIHSAGSLDVRGVNLNVMIIGRITQAPFDKFIGGNASLAKSRRPPSLRTPPARRSEILGSEGNV